MKYLVTNDGVYLYTSIRELLNDKVEDNYNGKSMNIAVYRFGPENLLLVQLDKTHMIITDPINNLSVMDVVFEDYEFNVDVIRILILERVRRYYKL